MIDNNKNKKDKIVEKYSCFSFPANCWLHNVNFENIKYIMNTIDEAHRQICLSISEKSLKIINILL